MNRLSQEQKSRILIYEMSLFSVLIVMVGVSYGEHPIRSDKLNITEISRDILQPVPPAIKSNLCPLCVFQHRLSVLIFDYNDLQWYVRVRS